MFARYKLIFLFCCVRSIKFKTRKKKKEREILPGLGGKSPSYFAGEFSLLDKEVMFAY